MAVGARGGATRISPEVGARYGARALNLRLRLLGLCDDEVGYLLPANAFTSGQYEERTSLRLRTAATLAEAYGRLLAVTSP